MPEEEMNVNARWSSIIFLSHKSPPPPLPPPSCAFENKANIKYVAFLGTLASLSSWFESVMTVRTSVTFIGSKFFLHIFTSSLQDWMAFTKLMTENFPLTDSLVFTNNNSPSNKQDNNAICQVVPFDSCFKACLNQFAGFNFK